MTNLELRRVGTENDEEIRPQPTRRTSW